MGLIDERPRPAFSTALAGKRTFAADIVDDGNRHATFNRTRRMCALGRAATAASSPALCECIGPRQCRTRLDFLPIGECLRAQLARKQ